MKNINKILISLLLLIFTHSLPAQVKSYGIKDVPNVQIVNKHQYTSDPSAILSTEVKSQIDQIIYRLKEKTGAEIAVVVLPSIGENDCFEFSHELFNYWGVGQKELDNGLLILLVTDQRCVQFYTGYGIEGILPDYTCKQIQVNAMVPFFKSGDWNRGMLAGVNAVNDILYDNMENGIVTQHPNDITTALPFIILACFTLVFFLIYLNTKKQRKCPNCGKSKLQRINSRIVERNFNYIITNDTYRCLNCGHTTNRKNKIFQNNHQSGPGGGPIIGGLGRGLGGGFGSGSFGGGGFGGGRGGGGGAGTRF